METLTHLTRISNNAKTGPIPVSTSSADTCPPSCPFKLQGCYAKGGPLASLVRAEIGSKTKDKVALLDELKEYIARVAKPE